MLQDSASPFVSFYSQRHMGKSLLCNQLAAYHDEAMKDDEVSCHFIDITNYCHESCCSRVSLRSRSFSEAIP
jgi:hypothetical protein